MTHNKANNIYKKTIPIPKITENPRQSPKTRKWNREIQWFQKMRKQHLALLGHGRWLYKRGGWGTGRSHDHHHPPSGLSQSFVVKFGGTPHRQ